jgi:enoyl-CoA hydratase/3-hydroxyacyl-CoA dehydrogenase
MAPIEAAAASGQALSREVLAILERAVLDAAAADSLEQALAIGYRAFGASACTAAAREGITAFLGGRKPDFGKTA